MAEVASNREQIEYWNEKAGPRWVAYQEKLDAQIAPFTRVVLDKVGLKPGERVLDIGCGCGATTLDAASRVRPGGEAVGADISRPMLQRARDRARAAGAANATFIEADAQAYDFGAGTFDAVISRFGVMFFADPMAAFANIHRALKSGGRLCFVCWRPVFENPWVTIPLRAVAEHIELPPPPDPNAPGPFAFADSDRLRKILASAGFLDVQIDRHDFRLPIGTTNDLEEAVEFAMNLGPVNSVLVDKPAAVLDRIRGSIREALAPHHTREGVLLDSASWLVSARSA